MRRKFFELVGVINLLVLALFLVGFVLQRTTSFASFNYGVRFRVNPVSNYTAYLDHETSGKMNFATDPANIGDLELVGVNHVTIIGNGAISDGFFPASADSDNGLGLPTDAIIDSLRFYSTDEAAGDSLRVLFYRNTAVATLISTDTLATNGAINYTGIAAASRDFNASANEKPSFFCDVKGTYTNGLIQVFWRSYDVQ